jgi:hypothetical protein
MDILLINSECIGFFKAIKNRKLILGGTNFLDFPLSKRRPSTLPVIPDCVSECVGVPVSPRNYTAGPGRCDPTCVHLLGDPGSRLLRMLVRDDSKLFILCFEGSSFSVGPEIQACCPRGEIGNF